MKIIYDNCQEVYLIKLKENETVFVVNTKDIVEARKEFIECMTMLFNNAICNELNDYEENNYESK